MISVSNLRILMVVCESAVTAFQLNRWSSHEYLEKVYNDQVRIKKIYRFHVKQ